MPSDLDRLVRRVDEDRWLASRFAPADVRRRLIAIYAVNYEIARTAEVVTDPGLGDIRLAWWRDALGEIHDGAAARAHPALTAYAKAHRETPLARATVEALIEARRKDVDAEPFATTAEFDAYLDATAGGVMRLAITACGEGPARTEAFVRRAAWLWGCVGLLRARAHWSARGRSFLARGDISHEALIARAQEALQALRKMERPSATAFPALGYVALASGYIGALRTGRSDAPLIMRQLTLIAAAGTGRI
jgi:phytoene synthase